MTVVPAGTSRTTTALAPIRALSPIVIAPSTFSSGTDDHAVANGRMTFTSKRAGTAKSDLVVEVDVITDLGGLPDHDPHPVIDDKPSTDLCRWMDLNACHPSADMGQEAA